MQLKKLLFIPFLLSGVAAMAQAPVLTGANYNPVPGDFSTGHYVHNVPQPAAGGANVVWDFSTLTDSASYYGDEFTACGTVLGNLDTLNCSGFLPNTVVSITGQYTIGGLYTADTARFTLIGGNGYTYSDGEDIMHYPITYQDAFTDTYTGTAPSPYGSAYTTIRSGTEQVTADGYGTLKLPGGVTYTDVLRMHVTEQYTMIDNAVGSTDTYTIETYNWVRPNNHDFVLHAEYGTSYYHNFDSTVTGGPYYYKQARYSTVNNLAVPGTGMAESSLKVYPNPALAIVNADFIINTPTAVRVTLSDVTGRTVATLANSKAAAGQQHYSYPTGNLPRGIYFLRVQAGTAGVTRKVEVL